MVIRSFGGKILTEQFARKWRKSGNIGKIESIYIMLKKYVIELARLSELLNNQTLDIDGRLRFAKRFIDNVKNVEIAAIDPDLIEAEASVPVDRILNKTAHSRRLV